MSMSSCEYCDQTPCVCGHDYNHYSIEHRAEIVKAVMKSMSCIDIFIGRSKIYGAISFVNDDEDLYVSYASSFPCLDDKKIKIDKEKLLNFLEKTIEESLKDTQNA